MKCGQRGALLGGGDGALSNPCGDFTAADKYGTKKRSREHHSTSFRLQTGEFCLHLESSIDRKQTMNDSRDKDLAGERFSSDTVRTGDSPLLPGAALYEKNVFSDLHRQIAMNS